MGDSKRQKERVVSQDVIRVDEGMQTINDEVTNKSI